MNAAQILAWLEKHGRKVVIQEIPPYRRRKNAVLLEYAAASGDRGAVGGYTVTDAVQKAASRSQATPEVTHV